MPKCLQGDVLELPDQLLIVFGHRGFNQMDVSWSGFRARFPNIDAMGVPFTSFDAEPHEYAPGKYIATIPEESNHGMSNEMLRNTLEHYFDWARDNGFRSLATNGIMDTDHAGDTTANRASDDGRAQMLIELAKSYEYQFQVKITLTSMNDVFVRQEPASQRRACGNSTTNHSSQEGA